MLFIQFFVVVVFVNVNDIKLPFLRGEQSGECLF